MIYKKQITAIQYDSCIPYISANLPCKGGIIAPPNIIITRNEEPWEVYFPRPLILRAKIEGHIIEQNNPPLKNANNAKLPDENNPTITDKTPKSPKILRVNAGFSLPIKKPPICNATQIENI